MTHIGSSSSLYWVYVRFCLAYAIDAIQDLTWH